MHSENIQHSCFNTQEDNVKNVRCLLWCYVSQIVGDCSKCVVMFIMLQS